MNQLIKRRKRKPDYGSDTLQLLSHCYKMTPLDDDNQDPQPSSEGFEPMTTTDKISEDSSLRDSDGNGIIGLDDISLNGEGSGTDEIFGLDDISLNGEGSGTDDSESGSLLAPGQMKGQHIGIIDLHNL